MIAGPHVENRSQSCRITLPGAVIGLIIANVVVFLVQSGLPTDLAEQFIYHNALVPARYTQPEFASELGLDPGNFLPILTNSFMHGGWLHLIVNMWTLWIFGRARQRRKQAQGSGQQDAESGRGHGKPPVR